MEIRELSENAIADVINIHLQAFEGFFLSELGRDFLKLYYKSVKMSDEGILLGYYENNQLLGFCAATTLSRSFNKKLILKNIIPFSVVGLKLVFTKPNALKRLYKNLTKDSVTVRDEGEYAELLSIATNPSTQGKGVGKLLIAELESHLKKRECVQLSLTTDYYNNEKALGFYKASGYEIMYELIAYPNRKMYRLIKQL